MHNTSKPHYDVVLMSDDIARKGWLPIDLARQADIAPMTVYRFLRRERQTARTATKLATALGEAIGRYLISSGAVRLRRRRAEDRVNEEKEMAS